MAVHCFTNDILSKIHNFTHNITNLLDTTVKFKDYKKRMIYRCKLGLKNSYKYYSDKHFYNHINSLYDGKIDIYIDLRDNETITDEGICRLAQNTKIHTLNLHGCYNITNEGIKHLGNVHTLDIGHNQNISENGLRHLGNVHTLILSCDRGITDDCLRHLGNVHTLNLYCCHSITNNGLKYLRNIHILDISWIKNITSVSSLDIRKLHSLNLGYTNITDESVQYLAKNGNLHTLNLSCCNITDDSVKHLGNLHTLNLWCCKKITDDGVKHLGKLHTLNLHSCNKITNEGIRHLGKLHTININKFGNNITHIGFEHIKNVQLSDHSWNNSRITFQFGNWGGVSS